MFKNVEILENVSKSIGDQIVTRVVFRCDQGTGIRYYRGQYSNSDLLNRLSSQDANLNLLTDVSVHLNFETS